MGGRRKGKAGEGERQRAPMRVVPRMLVEDSQSEDEIFFVDPGTSSDGSDLDGSDSGEGVAGSRAEGSDGRAGDRETEGGGRTPILRVS